MDADQLNRVLHSCFHDFNVKCQTIALYAPLLQKCILELKNDKSFINKLKGEGRKVVIRVL